MSYKNAQHYRHTVHRYLDAIWVLSSHKGKARSSMYKWLATKMNIPEEEAHVKLFNRAQCKRAIKILRPMYIQLYGKDLEYKKTPKEVKEKEVMYEKMYYSSKTTKVYVSYTKPDGKHLGSCWNITISCKAKDLNETGKVYDYSKTDAKLIQKLGNEDISNIFEFPITLENIAKWIWEQIISCYKVEIKTENGECVIYEEDKD